MRKFLRMIGSNRCLGVHIGAQRIAWTTLDRWSTREKVRESGSGEMSHDTPETALVLLGETIASHVKENGPHSPIVIGISPERTYVASMPDVQLEELVQPSALLARHGYFGGGSIESMVVEVIGQSDGLTAVVACNRDWVKRVADACVQAGALAVRIEPAINLLSCSAFAGARTLKPRPRASDLVIHLIPSEAGLLAVLARGIQPLACRSLRAETAADANGERVAMECHAAIRGLEVYAEQRMKLASQPMVVIQSGCAVPGLAGRLQTTLGCDVHEVNAKECSGAEIAIGLAKAARGSQRDRPDLGRTFWPSPELIALVPLREAGALAAATAMFTVWMWWGVWDLQSRARGLEIRNQLDSVLSSAAESDLRAERTRLEAEVSSVRRFVSTRRLWTSCLDEVAARVPPSATLEGVLGQEELTTGLSKADKRAKRQLLVDFIAEFPVDSSVPPEADEALRMLRASPILSKFYPVTELASLRLDRNKAAADAPDKAKFSILCRPRAVSDE